MNDLPIDYITEKGKIKLMVIGKIYDFGEGHLRITFCCTENEINKAFDRMEKYFS